MVVPKQKLRKNIEGYLDHQGIFHPIRNGEKEQGARYLPGLAGDNDDVFDREIRKEKNRNKADEIYEKRMMDAALEDALGDERKISLSQFVRRSGGIFYDPKYNDPYNGELENLSFKQSKTKGLAHKNGKYSLDGMRESADLAGYASTSGFPLTTINDFLDALESDLKGKKIYPFGTLGAYKFNPSTQSKNLLKKQVSNLDRIIRKLKKQKGKSRKIANLEKVKQTALSLMSRPSPARLKKNGIITTAADLLVGASAAVGLYDRFNKNKKPISQKRTQHGQVVLTNNPLKKNKGPEQQKAIHEKSFQNALVAIESGDLSKQDLAKIQGKLAGYEPNEVSRAIQYARLTYKLKHNPTLGNIRAAQNAILKENGRLKANGIIGRALARHKAGKEYKRQLRLEAAIDRAKKRRAAAEAKAKKNPTKPTKKPKFKIGDKVYSYWNESTPGSIGQMTFDDYGKFWKYAVNHPQNGRRWINENSLSKRKLKKNPAKVESASYEAFQGRKPTKVLELECPEGCPKHPYALGKLFELRLRGKPNINFRREVTGKTFYLVADEQNKQIWIVGGKIADPDNSIKKGYSEPYAEITHVVYETRKNHLDDKKQTGYIHRFGEDGGEEPTLAFDKDGFGIIAGGSYEITPLGIAD